MISNNALHKNEDALSRSLERLSSGLKINHGKDNPAGLAMGKRMNAQLEGLSVASQNAANGVSIIETADGAMTEMHSILQRISELSVKASTGTLTDADRETIDEEVQALKEELTRIEKDTQFNGQNLLDGEFDMKGYTSEETIKVTDYSDSAPATIYQFQELKITGRDAQNHITEVKFTSAPGSEIPADAAVADIKDDCVTIKGSNDFELRLDLSATTQDSFSGLEVDLTGIGAMRLQIGANEGQVLEVRIPEVSLKNMGIEEVNTKTQEAATDTLERVKGAISFVSSVRSRLGAYQNRLESNIGSLDITTENMTASYSRIMDVDMADEMTEYTKSQVLSQAGTSMLAQANQRPSQVLQLLQ